MELNTYIDSGVLELYVFGLLSDEENTEVGNMASKHVEINEEIISIERAIVDLSTSFSPFLSPENFEKIRQALLIKHDVKVVEMKPRSNFALYLGWAAALLLLIGAGYFYTQLNQSNMQVVTAENEKTKLQENLILLEAKNAQTESVLAIVTDKNSLVVPLGGQAIAPEAYAKVYYNQETQVAYVDAAGLPEPPEGKVYQVWSLKMNPLTPNSIGLLENFSAEGQKLFAVTFAADSEGFGITLEPAGGSPTPTMDQLYALGVVKV